MSWKHVEDTKISLNYSANAVSVDYLGKYAALGARRGLCVITLDRTWERKTFYHNKKSEVGSVQFSPHASTSTLVANTVADTVQVWDIANSTTPLLSSFRAHKRAVTGLTWSYADPNLMATCSTDSFLNLWDIRDENRKPSRSFCAFTGGPSQLRWNPLSSHIIASAHDCEVRIWDTRKTDTYIAFITAHLSNILCLDWSPKYEDQLVTCGQDSQIKIWSYNQPKEYKLKTSTSFPVFRVRYTPFGEGLVTVSQKTDYQVRLWSLSNTPDNQNDISNINVFYGHTDVIKSFDFRITENENKNYQLVTWSKDQTLRLWSFTMPMQEECGYFPPQTTSHPNQVPIPLSNSDTSSPQTPLNNTPSDETSSSSFIKLRKSVDHMDLANMSYSQECKKIERELSEDITLEGINARNRCCIFRVETKSNNVQSLPGQMSPSFSVVRLQVSFPLLYPNGASPMFEFLQSKSSLSIYVMKELKEILTSTANELVSQNRHCMLQCMSGMLDILRTMNLPENNEHVEGSSLLLPQPSPVRSRNLSHPALNTLSVDGGVFVDYPLQSPFKSKPIYGGIERVERVAKKTSGLRIMAPPTCFATFSPTGQLVYVNNFSGRIPFPPNKVPRYYDQLRNLMAESKPNTISNSPSSTAVSPISSPKATVPQLSASPSSSTTSITSALSSSLKQKVNVEAQDYFQSIFSGYPGAHDSFSVSTTVSGVSQNIATNITNTTLPTLSPAPSTANVMLSTQEPVQLKLDTRVHVYDTRPILPISYTLANELQVCGGKSIHEVCMANAAACSRAGRRSQARMWEVLAQSADPKVVDQKSWAYHPMGRKLVERFIHKYMQLGDIQTVAVLSCVLMLRQEDGTYDHWLLNHDLEQFYRHVRTYYGDILHRWKFDCRRSEILKFNYKLPLDQQHHLSDDLRALRCAIEFDELSEEVRPAKGSNRSPVFHCCLCRLPVHGLNMICDVCGHGGHADHIRKWFSQHDTCATGCTCHCMQYLGEYPQGNSLSNLVLLPNSQATATPAVMDENSHEFLQDGVPAENGAVGTKTVGSNSSLRRSHTFNHQHGRYPSDLSSLNISPPALQNPIIRSVSQDEMGTEEAQAAHLPSKRSSCSFLTSTTSNPSAMNRTGTTKSRGTSYFRTYQY